MRIPSPHALPIRVYYEDTDFSGVVYHASYLRFMERGRTELLRDLGIDQQTAFSGEAGSAFGFAVRSMAIDFLRPARMDDLLTIETTPAMLKGASLDLTQRVLRGHEVLVEARVRVACVSQGRAARMPDFVRKKLAQP
jgi:acyl-CoA thioester hydrolase